MCLLENANKPTNVVTYELVRGSIYLGEFGGSVINNYVYSMSSR